MARDGGRSIDDYDVSPLGAHWYLDYATQVTPSEPTGMSFAQMIRPNQWARSGITTTLEAVLSENPGTLWIVGNEPDRDKQDGLTPAEYADFYHDVYHFLKERDPTSRVAIAGVVQSTPLRRHYLDLVLAAYQSSYGTAMPIDIWTLHAFILPENYIWGASIPPGMAEFADEGMQYTIDDHDNLTIFQTNIVAFREWMAANGYRDKPLIITEYGILLSDLHGFPYAVVRDFMLGTFDYFLSAADDQVGYAADNNRLVQAWSWFSLNYPPYDPDTGFGHNGNLVTPDEGLLLELGRDYGNYVASLEESSQVVLTTPDFGVANGVVISPTTTIGGTIPDTSQRSTTWPPLLQVEATLHNAGTAAGCNLQIALSYQSPTGERLLIERRTLNLLDAGATIKLLFPWQPEALLPGIHQFVLEVSTDNASTGLMTARHENRSSLLVLTEANAHFLHLPFIQR